MSHANGDSVTPSIAEANGHAPGAFALDAIPSPLLRVDTRGAIAEANARAAALLGEAPESLAGPLVVRRGRRGRPGRPRARPLDA